MKDKIRLEVLKLWDPGEDIETVVENILSLINGNEECSCRPNTDLYCETITRCAKCGNKVKTIRPF